MKLLNIKTAYGLAKTLYDVSPSEGTFEDLALNAWELIGTKHTKLCKFVTDTVNKTIELPCDVELIESVSSTQGPYQETSPITNNSTNNDIIENHIDSRNHESDPYYYKGKLLKYKEVGNTLYFNRDYKNVVIIYHGIESDESGLPLINEKEMKAIAAYVGYATLYRDGIRKKDGDLIKLAQSVNADWLKYCNAARIPSHFTQNDMDGILDAKTRWDRKQYGKPIKPIL